MLQIFQINGYLFIDDASKKKIEKSDLNNVNPIASFCIPNKVFEILR